uniref:Transmembrane protein n=1 Tax=Steinernema glaseri TaxID=37863 RepID=A0A1I8A4M5_9BILA
MVADVSKKMNKQIAHTAIRYAGNHRILQNRALVPVRQAALNMATWPKLKKLEIRYSTRRHRRPTVKESSLPSSATQAAKQNRTLCEFLPAIFLGYLVGKFLTIFLDIWIWT